MTLPSLYLLSAEIQDITEQLVSEGFDDDAIKDTLDLLTGTLEAKAIDIALLTRNLETTADAIKEAETKMMERRKSIERKAERIKEYIKVNMESAGITKIDSPYFKIAIQNNPPSVVIEDESMIPDEFMSIPKPPPPVPDKKAIAVALKNNDIVPGTWLKQGTRLVIK